jgi:lipoprotein-releasing system ATP-binding protein
MLHVTDLTKTYPSPRGDLTVLDRVSFELAPGEAAAVTGPSGSGKSSLLYILGALEAPSSGRVTLDGRNPFELSPKALAGFRNEQIGFVFQDHCLLPQCTVLENVLVPTLVASSRGGPGADVTARARELVAQVGLADRIDHRPGELSGGERQRVAIARALVRQPRLLLCDEPTGNLDHAAAANVAGILLDLHRARNTILIVVTHSAELAGKLPRRYELRDGALQTRREAIAGATAPPPTP